MRGFRGQIAVGFPEGNDVAFADFMQVVRSLGLLDEFDELDHAADLQAAMGFGALADIVVGQGLDLFNQYRHAPPPDARGPVPETGCCGRGDPVFRRWLRQCEAALPCRHARPILQYRC